MPTIPCDSTSKSGANKLVCTSPTITGNDTVDNNASLKTDGSVCLSGAVCNKSNENGIHIIHISKSVHVQNYSALLLWF